MKNSEVIKSISKRLGIRETYVKGIIYLYFDTIIRDLIKNSSPHEKSKFNIPWIWTIKVEYKMYKNPSILRSKKWMIIKKYVPSMSFSSKLKETINKRD